VLRKVQSESDFMPARAVPSGFAAPYHFLISPTCGFTFGDAGTCTGTCFHVEYIPHPVLKGLTALGACLIF